MYLVLGRATVPNERPFMADLALKPVDVAGPEFLPGPRGPVGPAEVPALGRGGRSAGRRGQLHPSD